MNILIVGLTTEGTTDVRFLESIIRRTFENIAFECAGEISIHDVIHVSINDPDNKLDFVDKILKLANVAQDKGIMALCVHVDADNNTDTNANEKKINPAFLAVQQEDKNICKNLVATIPVRMTEAWMLADTELLKQEIGTTKSDDDLGLPKKPENIADPKEKIKEAIRIAFADSTRRKRNRSLDISELYLPIGQKIRLEKLAFLPSYVKFRDAVREAFVKLNYLH